MFAGPVPYGNSTCDADASVALGFLAPWIILGFSFLVACGAPLDDPAWQASVDVIVDRGDVSAAVTLLSFGVKAVWTAGPRSWAS
ncbi:MFS transporter [Mesorhizobium sp. M0213]|uniref:MFS transporter n=1 Tax=Mesorhizobium sp. M0213 TaxID=2956917 RepID=UPI0033356942